MNAAPRDPEKRENAERKKGKNVRPGFAVDMSALDKFRDVKRVMKDSALLNPRRGALKSSVRIFGAMLAAVFAASVCIMAWTSFSEWREKTEKLKKIEAELAASNAALPQLEGVAKDRALLKAFALCESALSLASGGDKDAWTAKAESFKKRIAGMKPVLGAPKGEPYVIPEVLIEMRHVPQCRFFMGRRSYEKGGDDELPRHAVSVPYEFWIAATETSNSQLRALFKKAHTPSWRKAFLDRANQPAGWIDWSSAMRYCETLTKIESAAGRLPEGYEYRLPTEAEWECAARAGTESYYFWSDDFPKLGAEFCNSLDVAAAERFGWQVERDMIPSDGFLASAPVASFKPNALGLYDVSGNVWEWTLDWYNPQAYRELPEESPFQAKPVKVKLAKTNAFEGKVWEVDAFCKVIRGGAWATTPEHCRSAARDYVTPDYKNIDIGFRIVLGPVLKCEPSTEAPAGKDSKK